MTHLLSYTANTSISNNSDRESSGKTSESDRETGTKLNESSVKSHGRLEVTRDEDRDNETVDLCGRVRGVDGEQSGRSR